MLTESEKSQIRKVLEQARQRLQRTSQNALTYSMNHERNIGRDSIDESMEEELFSTEMRLHDREKFLLGKINKQLARLENGGHRRLRGVRRVHLLPPPAGPPGDHPVHRVQGAERAGRGGRSPRPGGAASPTKKLGDELSATANARSPASARSRTDGRRLGAAAGRGRRGPRRTSRSRGEAIGPECASRGVNCA